MYEYWNYYRKQVQSYLNVPHKLVQVIGLFTMGGQEVEQEVVLACVKDIIGQGREIFLGILSAREIKYFQGQYWSENLLDNQK